MEILSTEWALRALAASIMVGLMCGVLGCFIVLRNMSLLGDALSHAILPGIFVAFVFFGYSTIAFFLGSALAGLVAALIISWIQQNVQTKNDAAIGIIFTAMFSLGVMGISWLNQSKGAHLDLKDFLFGNVLGVSNEDLILSGFVLVYTLLSVTLLYRYLFITTFQPKIAQAMGISVKTIHYYLMLLLSFVVVASLRTVGVILVVAMLITPAATALLLSPKLKHVLVLSGLIGMLSAFLGFLVAFAFGTTPGPAMCIVATCFYFLVALFAPGTGLISKFWVRRIESRRILAEDIIRFIDKSPGDVVTSKSVFDSISVPNYRLKSVLNKLIKAKLLSKVGSDIALSDLGIIKANNLQRAHRLWETYQHNTMGIDPDLVHWEADKQEHHLDDEILGEVERKLGYPEADPHGSPIPKKK